jgi:hypothetical protein
MPTAAPHTLEDGPAREALRQAAAILDIAELTGQPFAMCEALAQMGRCYRALAAHTAAEASFAQALRWSRLTGGADMSIDLLCDLAEVAADQADRAEEDEDEAAVRGARERARDHAFSAATEAASATDTDWEATALIRVSSVLERCGDRVDAQALQRRARHLRNGTLPAAPDIATMSPRGAA